MPRLSLAKLERHLYSAADRLRQEGLDAATYKDYIFGMLFLKRSSDVFDAENEKLVGGKVQQGMALNEAQAQYGENPDYYDGFFVPERARCVSLQTKLGNATEPYDSVLDKALGVPSEATSRLSTCWTISASCTYRATSALSPTTPARTWGATPVRTACATRTSKILSRWVRPMSS